MRNIPRRRLTVFATMLRSDFRFPLTHWPQRLAAFLLGESFLGFLAIVAVGLTLFQMIFSGPPAAHARLDALQWVIIAWFAVEYMAALLLAPAKRAFILNPWRLLDVATILVPLAALLPNASQVVLSSPALRLIRLARLVTLGVRVSGVAARHRPAARTVASQTTALELTRMADASGTKPVPATWDEILQWAGPDGEAWHHVAGPSPAQLAELGRASGLPPGFLENHLLNTNYPHLAAARGHTAVFLWVPDTSAPGRSERHGLLLLISGQDVLTLARQATPAMHATIAAATADDEATQAAPLPARVLARVVQAVLRRNEELVGRLERELRALEDIPVRESSPAFFERTFQVKKELSAAQGDLWRLKGVIADLAGGDALPATGDAAAETFRRLATDGEYLYETVVNVRDEVLSVLELHLNIVSFDMNRVMRTIAVVSVLGLIPAVIGGLFGMNLIDNPWPFTLPQVAFTITFAMVLCVYFFFVKGWLR